jgi:hypothetical protein
MSKCYLFSTDDVYLHLGFTFGTLIHGHPFPRLAEAHISLPMKHLEPDWRHDFRNQTRSV